MHEPPPVPLQPSGEPSAGHDGSFYISDGDRFRLEIGGTLQFRYVASFRDHDNATDDDSNLTHGFQARRTHLEFRGHALSEDLRFRIRGNFTRDPGVFTLDYAQFEYRFGEGWAIRAGQFKPPLLAEEQVSSVKQLAVERTVTNEAFTADYGQGLMLSRTTDRWRIQAGFFDGANSSNTEFNGPGEADVVLNARFELMLGDGGWSRFGDFTSWRGSPFAARLGAAVQWQTFGETGVGADSILARAIVTDADTLHWTADAALEGDGWHALGAIMGVRIDPEDADQTHTLGALVQGGLFVTDQTELFARWDAVFYDSTFGLEDDALHHLTLGAVHYFLPESHAAKLTADVVIGLDGAESATGLRLPVTRGRALRQTGAGQLGRADGEVVLRVQFQLLF